jgi:hypothetical protein
MKRTTATFRIPADVLAAAKVEAARRGETLTAAVVRFLKRYGKGRG